MGSLFEYRHRLRRHLPWKRADLFGDCCGCRFDTAASCDCKQQERLSSHHVESDAGREQRDDAYAGYHDNLDFDDHNDTDDDYYYFYVHNNQYYIC